jgi:hypothetical protein
MENQREFLSADYCRVNFLIDEFNGRPNYD